MNDLNEGCKTFLKKNNSNINSIIKYNLVPMAEIVSRYEDTVYCILENKVYDITEISHPGG